MLPVIYMQGSCTLSNNGNCTTVNCKYRGQKSLVVCVKI